MIYPVKHDQGGKEGKNMIFQENGIFVKSHEGGHWTVFRPSKSGTHAESDSAYPAGFDGLGLAIARALYLSRGPGRHAAKATRLALEYFDKAKAHA